MGKARPRARHSRSLRRSSSRLRPALGVDYDENWAGYDISGSSFTAVSGSFNVPTLYAATKHTTSSEWVGIDGAANDSLIQAGVAQKYDPTTGLVYDHAWWEILPAAETIVPLACLDRRRGLRRHRSNRRTRWRISITNDTTGQRFVTNQTYVGPSESAEWIVEAPTSGATGALETLGGFTPNVTFADASLRGQRDDPHRGRDGSGRRDRGHSLPVLRDAFVVGYGATAPTRPA